MTDWCDKLRDNLPLICVCGNRDHGRPGLPCSAECKGPPTSQTGPMRRMALDLRTLVLWAYRAGWARGVREYAVWRDGEQLVGVSEKPLADVLAEGPPPEYEAVDLHPSGRNLPGLDDPGT